MKFEKLIANQSIKASLRSVVIVGFNGILAFFIRRTLSISLPSENFGYFYSLFSFFSIAAIVFDIGLSQSSIILIAKYESSVSRADTKRIYASIMVFKLIIILIIIPFFLVFSEPVSFFFFHRSDGSTAFAFMSLWFTAMMLNMALIAFLDGMKDFTARNMLLFSNFSISFSLLLVLSFLGELNLNRAALIYAVSHIIPVVIFIVYIYFKYSLFPIITTKQFYLGMCELLKIGKWVALSISGLYIIFNLDTVMLTQLASYTDVARYNIAVPIMQIILGFMILIPQISFPILSYKWNYSKYAEVKIRLRYIYALSIGLILIVLPLFFVFGDILITLLFGEQYKSIKLTASILLLTIPFNVLSHLNINMLNMSGYERRASLIVALGLLLNISMNLVLIPIIGINGAALASLFSHSSMFLVSLVFCNIIIAKQISIRH